jgi:DNA/RNA endonuclease YhcR with UshA esterase domain
MRRFVQFVSLVSLLALTLPTPAIAQKKLTASEAKEHFGETATVCGEVVSTRYADSTKGQPTFLNLDKPYPNQVFTVVVWGNNRGKFGTPENEYKGKRICITGKITAYAGLPEIVADEPKQIKIDAGK